MSRPLTNEEEGLRKEFRCRLSDAMREHLAEIKRRERLDSLSDAVDWLIRRDHGASVRR